MQFFFFDWSKVLLLQQQKNIFFKTSNLHVHSDEIFSANVSYKSDAYK